MGNPHPTKSKPCKIGRKHTGAPSLRVIGRRRKASLKAEKDKAVKFKSFKKEVKKYFLGERDTYPEKPTTAKKREPTSNLPTPSEPSTPPNPSTPTQSAAAS